MSPLRGLAEGRAVGSVWRPFGASVDSPINDQFSANQVMALPSFHSVNSGLQVPDWERLKIGGAVVLQNRFPLNIDDCNGVDTAFPKNLVRSGIWIKFKRFRGSVHR